MKQDNKKKGLCIIALLLALTLDSSAVKLEYSKFFPECSFKDSDLNLISVTRCGCYFFIPNAHLEAGYDLIIRSTAEGVMQVWNLWLQNIGQLLSVFNLNTITQLMTDPLDFFNNQVTLIFQLVISPFTLVLDVLTGVIVWLILLLFEFIKTYLFWIVLPLGALNLLFYGIALMMHHSYAFKGGDIISNPLIMAAVITFAIMIGSILLVTMDVGLFNIKII